MKIIILKLPRTVTKEKLAVLFEAHGDVKSCDIVLDKETGKSKGFAFVEMPNPDEANEAIKELNGKKIGNNTIKVKLSDQNK